MRYGRSLQRDLLRGLTLAICALLTVGPAFAIDKPSPPQPPEPPKAPPGDPPPPPGIHVPLQLRGPSDGSTTSQGAVQVRPDGLGFESAGPTAVAQPGQVLRGRLEVFVTEPTETRVTWRVDGMPVATTQLFLDRGTHSIMSPPLPTEEPGRFVVDAEVNRTLSVATSYTVIGRPRMEFAERELSALLVRPETAQEVAGATGLLLVQVVPLESGVGALATYQAPPDLDPEDALMRLRAHPQVQVVGRSGLFETQAGGRLRDLQYAPQAIDLPPARRWTSGRGVTVAVVDTGADLGHPEFAGRVERAGDFAPPVSAPEVHGTAVLGVLSASRALMGVAPDSRVLLIRACWAVRPGGLDARCRTDTLVRAFDHAMRLGVQVINASIGGPPDPILRWVVQRAIERGILVVAAAARGPGNEPLDPAGIPGVLAVGSIDARNRPAPYSPSGSFLSLVAPGVDILTTMPGGRYLFVSGTSFAAAHVTGSAALFQGVAGQVGGLKTRRVLEQTAVDLGPPGYDPQFGYGRVSACRPIAVLLTQARCF